MTGQSVTQHVALLPLLTSPYVEACAPSLGFFRVKKQQKREKMKLLALFATLFAVASADDSKKGPLVTDKVRPKFF